MSLNFKRAALVAVLAFSGFAHAGVFSFIDGNKLLADIQNKENNYFVFGTALGYVVGVADRVGSDPRSWSLICPEEHVTQGQMVKVVQKYLEDHPETLHFRAASLVVSALHQAFPCPTK